MPTKEKLLEAAVELMSRNGYHRTKVADIVERAGVAQGTFYIYFASKKALFIHLVEGFSDLLAEAVLNFNLDENAKLSQEAFARQIKSAIRNVLVVYRENAVLARLFLREAIGLDPDFVDLWDSITERLAISGITVMDIAIERQLLPPQNSQIVAHSVVGMIERVAYFWLFQGGRDYELEEVVNALARFELLGICGQPTDAMRQVLAGGEDDSTLLNLNKE